MPRFLIPTILLLTLAALALTATPPAPPAAADASKDQRMAWWREARFGMFIHWGLYASLGGEYRGFDYGKEMGGGSCEHIFYRTPIPVDEYAGLAKTFNPVKFDAAEWVSLAKQAGMKYMVITSKHHDGFSMFGTKQSKYNIVDATPFGRDVIAELASECERQGLKFGVYYSHSIDWYNRKRTWHKQPEPTPEYVGFVKGQLTELLTNYPISLLWFDTGDQFAETNSEYGRLVKALSPGAIVSGRLRGTEDIADYRSEGDRRIPPARVEGDVETPMTMRDNWGYDRDESNWKSLKDMLERFSLTVCRGANMLLNVGPTPGGTFTPEEVALLKGIGEWMDVNSEAVYGTTAGPFPFDFEWGSISQKPGKLYLHVLKWNPSGITFHGLKSRVRRAYLLADKSKSPLKVDQDLAAGTITVRVAPSAPAGYVNVIVLDLDGDLKTDPAATGEYVWFKDVDIVQNKAKMAAQKAKGWDPTWSWDSDTPHFQQ